MSAPLHRLPCDSWVGRRRNKQNFWWKVDLPVLFGSLGWVQRYELLDSRYPQKNEHADNRSDLDRSQLLRMGFSMLHLQRCRPAPRRGMVRKIHHDHVRCARFGLSFCVGGRLLRRRLSGLDGRVRMVGDGGLQAGKCYHPFLPQPSRKAHSDFWPNRVAVAKLVPTNAWRLESTSERHNCPQGTHISSNNALYSLVSCKLTDCRYLRTWTYFKPSLPDQTIPKTVPPLNTTYLIAIAMHDIIACQSQSSRGTLFKSSL